MAQGTQPPNRYFELINSVASNPKWKCLVCGRQMGEIGIGPHLISAPHLEAVARYEACLAAENAVLPGLNDDPPLSPTVPASQEDMFGDNDPAPDTDTTRRPPSPFSYLRAFQLAQANQPSDSDDSDKEIDVHKVLEAIRAMDDDDDWGPMDEAADEAILEADMRSGQLLDSSEWYPFKKKEEQIETDSLLSFPRTARCRTLDHWLYSKHFITVPIPSNPRHIADMQSALA
ncbi:uncharacterized protein MELLADRAFT_90509 [Melampsora larici-populina 98AG31]|uniref:Uncharacterized protein n=1 Tax=Melampsora larici-populina (strain 98AG31 / pathotype 3-4-7) TaxID=747676 RepID=F4RX59_MELLP|nr:uncharacterized protein MELLADRAFT_90509 [Melampsora larici-populina 98AG31]EGG03042.1 hypothetical protein MELLADRAFT_90509 [Melampsora larici-populina 98AG31]